MSLNENNGCLYPNKYSTRSKMPTKFGVYKFGELERLDVYDDANEI